MCVWWGGAYRLAQQLLPGNCSNALLMVGNHCLMDARSCGFKEVKNVLMFHVVILVFFLWFVLK